MIYITGDTHRSVHFEKLLVFAKNNPQLTKNDYVIIAGDFGGVFFEETLSEDLKHYSSLPFTVLFVDGNHENFTLLNSYPVSLWNGGKVHKIKDDIIHLMRGQIFVIEGIKIFTFGGATSIDKERRIIGYSYWDEEVPSYLEYEEALNNLEKHDFKVDYIITHSIDERVLYYPSFRDNVEKAKVYPENRLLSNFQDLVNYKKWYFGHYHKDEIINDKKRAIFLDVIELGK